jgi:hypothetical protein
VIYLVKSGVAESADAADLKFYAKLSSSHFAFKPELLNRLSVSVFNPTALIPNNCSSRARYIQPSGNAVAVRLLLSV